MTSLFQVGRLIEQVDIEWTYGFYMMLSENYGYVIDEQSNKVKKQDRQEAFNMDEVCGEIHQEIVGRR